MKKRSIVGNDISVEEKKYIDNIKKQNPYGIITLMMGGVSFLFGPIIVFLPIATLLFGLLTFRTFDRKIEDNPWTFYIGIGLAGYGLYLFITNYQHEIIL
ncbi:cell division protein FtsK [Evansella sp. AB-P1]|uniref:cell division protein FtsK n=1 Tax=Evansella sp. AB-P1 TaxID=3037653 RepID=UPI00241EA773|nr:cell division protein FtsK [Evansella sp. AB-P1]MDG5789082.1 cell division protein FtsK [Evansella sp. AB-P1]